MNLIQKLPETVISQIAAGEVIESPAGLLKELIENSLDAHADEISIFIEGGGFTSIQIRDNGKGIYKEDLALSVESFATSKVRTIEDVLNLNSLGFRGEALSSIRSVSKMTIESKHEDANESYSINASAEKISSPKRCALPKGTRIVIQDLFYNTPVRKEFHKNFKTIKKNLTNLIADFAISHFKVEFLFHYDQKEIFRLKKANNLLTRIAHIYPGEMSENLRPLYASVAKKSIEGYASNFSYYKSNGSFQKLFINSRIVQYKKLPGILRSIYGELLPPGRFPVCFLFLNMPANDLDINVHPQKREVRFKDENLIYKFLYDSIRSSLEGKGPLRNIHLHRANKKIFKTLETEQSILSERNQTPETNSYVPELDFASPPLPEEKTQNPNIEFKDLLPKAIHARLYKTFILASTEKGIFLIDQHTAHERINYEKFLKKLKQNQSVAQSLLTSIPLELSRGEYDLAVSKSAILKKLGFQIEDLGPAGLSLSSIPFYLKPTEEKSAFIKALSLIEKTETSQEANLSAEFLFKEMAASLACRASVKKGDHESLANLSELILQLEDCEHPSRCPHGRPTTVFIGREDVFALFKRKAD